MSTFSSDFYSQQQTGLHELAAGADVKMHTHLIHLGRAKLIPHRDIQPLELTRALVARLPAKLTQTFMGAIGTAVPADDLKHLKRVRKVEGLQGQLEILLVGQEIVQQLETPQLSDTASCIHLPIPQAYSELRRMMPEKVVDLIEEHMMALLVYQVPARPPQTKKQWEEWGSQYWPMAWKVPDGAAPPTGDELLASPEEQAYFERHMLQLLNNFSERHTNNSCTCNAALLIDPCSGKVVGCGFDERHQHPLRHAAMVAVHAASVRDLAMWPDRPESHDDTPDVHHSETQHSPVINNTPAVASHTRTVDVSHDASVSPASKRLRTDPDAEAASHHTSGHAHASHPLQATAQVLTTTSALPSKPYMCTGYDCFLVHEPCMMCAMALVHSRVSRVIFCNKDPMGGALGGKFMLMKQKSLNHHYKVYHLPQLA